MKGAARTDPETGFPDPVPAIYSLQCIMGAPRTVVPRKYDKLIEFTLVVISKRFRCHILWIWRNLTEFYETVVNSVPGYKLDGHWLSRFHNQPISDSVAFKAGIAQYRLGKVVSVGA
jgi:hypothetical protein